MKSKSIQSLTSLSLLQLLYLLSHLFPFLGFYIGFLIFFLKFLAIKSFADVAVYNISSKPGVSFYLPDISLVSFFT